MTASENTRHAGSLDQELLMHRQANSVEDRRREAEIREWKREVVGVCSGSEAVCPYFGLRFSNVLSESLPADGLLGIELALVLKGPASMRWKCGHRRI